MKVASTSEKQELEHPVQVGTPLISEPVSGEFENTGVDAAEVTFRPGERTKFHTHAGVQILYITEGKGIVATRDEEKEVSEGDLVIFPEGEEHWHGNTDEAEENFSHIHFLAESKDGELEIQEAP
ncbi:cupin domain-containing protein [Candidatus Nanohalococcus occultus]|uniref:cupin domain-containing protein n=1 Tax=Candidatus Nanohalococcus occultus TaxID=2978047 RepID=UPI0039DFE520